MDFQYKLYQRSLVGLKTSRGTHPTREGILLRLEEDGKVAYGEIAPWSGFSTESLSVAQRFCSSLQGKITREEISSIPNIMPCTQMAFHSALLSLDNFWESEQLDEFVPVAGLLSAGYDALAQVQALAAQGFTSLKWKIGAHPWEEEKAVAQELWNLLEEYDLQIRLDANGTLDEEHLDNWLTWLENKSRCEYLEQPLPPAKLREIKTWSERTKIPFALDESLCSFPALTEISWTGIWVIKPSLLGNLQKFLSWSNNHPKDWVISSTFETGIGFEHVLHTAATLGGKRAHGLGTLTYFKDDGLSAHSLQAKIPTTPLTPQARENIWNQA